MVVCHPDKGIGVVLINKADYTVKMHDTLKNTTKFTKVIHADLIKLNIKIEDKGNRFIKSMVKTGPVSEENSKSLKLSDSSPAILCGLWKVHKQSISLRPIMAAFKTVSFNKLAKF